MRWMATLVLTVLAILAGHPAVASEPFPAREIEIIVPFEPGGGTDLLARVVASRMSATLGKPVVVVNKPGAAGTVGSALLAQRKPDGHSLMTVTPSPIIFAPHRQKLTYDPLKDFTYLAGVVRQPFGIQVRADAPWRTLQELLEDAKRSPGKVKYGTDGVNSWGAIFMAAIGLDRGIVWTQVPFKGDSSLLPAFLGGHVDVAAMSVIWVPLAQAGKLRPLALVTDKRLSDFPETPTLNELGFDYFLGIGSITGFAAPKGLPDDVRKKLEDTIRAATESGEFRETAKRVSFEVDFRDGPRFARQVEQTYQSMADMMAKTGIK